MSLRFVFGPSGAGKSRLLYENLTKRSMEETERKFLVIVPDQFTMETQKDLVHFHERGGILNIDVLSFGRLSYRIFDEECLSWTIRERAWYYRRLPLHARNSCPHWEDIFTGRATFMR